MMEDLLPSIGRALLFLGIPFILGIFVLQFRWSKTCANNIRVLIAEKGGGGSYMLAPKEGGTVTIKNPELGTAKVWAVNELATIEVPYPGVGFVPIWMQKTIRLAIVSEGDWEPLLNRSPHRERVMSPDMVRLMKNIADTCNDEEVKEQIYTELGNVSTSPTREMIADPSTLGNLMQSSVMKALATVSNDLMDVMKQLNNKLNKTQGLNPTIVYIGIGLSCILSIAAIYMIVQATPNFETMSTITNDISSIKNSLGIK